MRLMGSWAWKTEPCQQGGARQGHLSNLSDKYLVREVVPLHSSSSYAYCTIEATMGSVHRSLRRVAGHAVAGFLPLRRNCLKDRSPAHPSS